MLQSKDRKRPRERLRQALWSGLLSLALSSFFLAPLDQVIWSLQAVFANFEASGDIAFIGAKADLTDPDYPKRREDLAHAVTKLKAAGAKSVYIDMAFERPSRSQSDLALNRALRDFGPGAFLVRSIVRGFGNDKSALENNVKPVGLGVAQVGGERMFDYFGIVWNMPYMVQFNDAAQRSAPASLAKAAGPGAEFPVNYGFRLSSIPSNRLEELDGLTPAALHARFAGKDVVIGGLGPEAQFAIPGHAAVPGGLLHIIAAETLKAGYVGTLPLVNLWLLGFIVLLFTSLLSSRNARRACHFGLALSVPACILATMLLGIRPCVSGLALLQVVYLAFRLRSKWRDNLLLVDQKTGLPTFAALEADRQVAIGHPAIIVAKMHRFEEVRQTLPIELHGDYVLRINDRLKAASPEMKIYLGPGHTIAWCMPENDPVLVKDHLEGLRALFASPLRVGGEQVDVGITFGVDISPSRDVTRRLANAVAEVERTTETYDHILIAETKSEEELIWNISLQARIDAALANDEIFLVYQPKIRTTTGEVTGMEALVRWRDPVRGLIPPDSFIRQCEETGRMGHLTRHVLSEACKAGAAESAKGYFFTIAVNISATLLHDSGIVAMVRTVLAETGFDPHLLTLEVTETYRISDMTRAGGNLRDLAALGATISLDDFGVGAASLEALLLLPIAELKIDRLFIDPITRDPRALGIVRSILELGRQLKIPVVAEGVEDDATLELLHEAGCPLAQGFGICRPVPLKEAVQFRDKQSKVSICLSV